MNMFQIEKMMYESDCICICDVCLLVPAKNLQFLSNKVLLWVIKNSKNAQLQKQKIILGLPH